MSPVKLTDDDIARAYHQWVQDAPRSKEHWLIAADFWEYVGATGGLHFGFDWHYLVSPETADRVRALSGPYRTPIVKGWYVVNRAKK